VLEINCEGQSIGRKHETGLCINCDRRETVELIECEAYRTERIVLLEQVKELGYTHLSVEGLFSFSASKPSAWPAIIRYLKETDLFNRI